MTALCFGGGTSSPKPLQNAVVVIGSSFVGFLLDKYGAGWLKWGIPLIPVPTLTLDVYCGTDPPAIPSFTAVETEAFLGLQFGANFDSCATKLGQLILNLAWTQLCACAAGPQPLFPGPAPAPPTGTPVLVPAPIANAVACLQVDGSINPIDGFIRNMSAGVNTNAAINPPVGTTSIDVKATFNLAGAGPHFAACAMQVKCISGSGTTLSTSVFMPCNGTKFNVTVPTGTTLIQVQETPGAPGSGTSTDNVVFHFDLWCNGASSGQPQTACCPPDQTLVDRLDQLVKMVTLIQRQNVPFALVESTMHTALSGAGALTVQGLIGVKIAVTTLPDSYGRAGTSPAEIFDLGYLTWRADDAYDQSLRLTHSSQISTPPRASLYTALAYDLAPGVVITVTELLREP